jgi:hypothetical protein
MPRARSPLPGPLVDPERFACGLERGLVAAPKDPIFRQLDYRFLLALLDWLHEILALHAQPPYQR